LLLASRLTYTHTGPKVFADQLNLVGIAGALLLPVARAPEAALEMLVAEESMFPEDHRLFLACPFPVGTAPEQLAQFFRWTVEAKRARAIKIHPNLAGIDPLSDAGRDLIEATLEAAGSLGLPVIVHGGCTPGLESSEAREYGSLFRLSGSIEPFLRTGHPCSCRLLQIGGRGNDPAHPAHRKAV
jgi:hypothetical protein